MWKGVCKGRCGKGFVKGGVANVEGGVEREVWLVWKGEVWLAWKGVCRGRCG